MLNVRATPAVAGAYLGGALLGAATSAAALLVLSGLLSPIPAEVRGVILLVLLLCLALRSVGVLNFALPQNSRQIPREVFLSKAPRAAFRFAYELGTSVRTYVTSEGPYVAALVILLAAPEQLVEAIGATALLAAGFGVGRAGIVSTQPLRRSLIMEHPRWALRAGTAVSLAAAASLAPLPSVG